METRNGVVSKHLTFAVADWQKWWQMARALRLEFEDALYHLCARGNRREQIFAAEKVGSHRLCRRCRYLRTGRNLFSVARALPVFASSRHLLRVFRVGKPSGANHYDVFTTCLRSV